MQRNSKKVFSVLFMWIKSAPEKLSYFLRTPTAAKHTLSAFSGYLCVDDMDR